MENHNNSSDPQLMDARGVARMLDISERSVWRLLKSGELPRPVRIGRSVRWRRDELAAYVRGLAPQTN